MAWGGTTAVEAGATGGAPIPVSPEGLPMLGLGTYGRTGDAGLAALMDALELGYRHFDTAQSYGTEANVGEALRRSGLLRGEVFVTTKIADTRLRRADALASVEASLEVLSLDRVDLLLIHWPAHGDAVPMEEYLGALAEAQARGWARRIGVSNFTAALLDQAEALLGRGRLATNQVEIHPYLQAPRLVADARRRGLRLTAYQPLARGRVAADPVLGRIATAQGVTAAAVALAFLMGEGHAVIPASASPGHLRDNLSALRVRLTAEDRAAIRALDCGLRLIDPPKSPLWDDPKGAA